jgi:hypothetical protein
MKTANLHGYHIRKWFQFVEETHANETGQLADGEPVYKVVIAAAIQNPYAGRYSENLDEILTNSPRLAGCCKTGVFKRRFGVHDDFQFWNRGRRHHFGVRWHCSAPSIAWFRRGPAPSAD